MTRMRAAQVREFGSIDKVSIVDLPLPTPGPKQVLVEVHAVPVNYVDLVVIAGKYQFMPTLPFTPGKGPAGMVAAVGSEVHNVRLGDRVLAMAEVGGYAEYAVAPSDQCYALPATISFEAAASMAVSFDTAWFSLVERGRLRAGETVLILGATGAVGNAAIQIAKAKGAKVIAGVSSLEKEQQCLDAGANATVNLGANNLRDSLREQVYALTEGRGADIVIDPLGDNVFDAAVRCLAWRGRLVIIGFAAGRIPSLKMNYVLLKNIEISGIQISDYRKRMPGAVNDAFQDIFAMCEAGEIKPPSIRCFRLEDVASALQRVTDRAVNERILLQPRN